MAVGCSTVCDNGTLSFAVMCFSELQVSTSYVLNNNSDVDILRINIGFVTTKSNGEYSEHLTSSRYLLNGSRTFVPVTTDVRHCWRDLTSERRHTSCYVCIDISQGRSSSSIIRSIYVFVPIRYQFISLRVLDYLY